MAHENSTGDTPPERDPTDVLLAVLADEQRREVLRYFQEVDDPVASVETLVDYLVESGHPVDARERERVHIRFRHSHLPKLVQIGIIEHDSDTTTVQYREHAGLESFLETLETIESATASSQTASKC